MVHEGFAWPGAPSGRDFGGTDRYRVVRRVGEGGMGVVYEAEDVVRGRPVALKTLNRFDADGIYRIKQEFRALSDVTHPHLVKLHELVFDADHWFFTMELVAGVDLLEWVHGPRPPAANEPAPDSLGPPSMPPGRLGPAPSLDSLGPVLSLPIGDEEETEPGSDAPPIAPMPIVERLPRTPKGRAFRSVAEADLERLGPAVGQLAEGIMALHATGRLHRDIKPSNVLVTELGRVVLLDFGLVTPVYDRLLVKSTVQGMVCGTVAYMSPEQGAGEPLSPASDWYSVGVVLFEALTGKLPFKGTMFRVLMDKQSKAAPAPRDLVPDVPERLDRLCRALLSIDPAARPDGPAILAALGQERVAQAAPSAAFTASLPTLGDFVGRHDELRTLTEAYGAVRAGRAQVVLVGGHSGVGKTALLRRFLESVAEDPSVAVLSGRCHERELMPFKGIDGIIDALSRYLRRLPFEDATALLPPDVALLPRLFPTLGRVEALAARAQEADDAGEATVELRKRAFDALRELLDRLARRTTLILSLDDLQWGDADSGELLCHLLAPPEPPPVLVLGSYRADGADDSPLLSVIAALEGAPRGLSVIRRVLGPLGRADAARLAATLLAEQGAVEPEGPPSRRADLIALESGGDPLFVYELALRAAQGRDLAAEVTATEATPVRRMRLEGVLVERIRSLPGAARRLLEVVSVGAGPVALSVGNQAAGLSAGDDATFALLKAQRLLRSGSGEGETVEVYHDRIRETVVRHLDPEVSRAHHGSLARVLKGAATPDPEALVFHLEHAGEAIEASRYARTAAQAAFSAMAFERAAALYGTALRLAAPDDDRRWQIVAWQAESLASAGRGAPAARAYLEAAAACEVVQGFELERRAAEQYLTSGHEAEGLALLQRLLRQVGLHWPKSPAQAMRAVALMRAKIALSRSSFAPSPSRGIPRRTKQQIDVCWSLATGLAMVDVVRAAYFAARMLSLALAAGDPLRAVKAFALEVVLVGGMDRAEGRTERLIQYLEGIAASVNRPQAEGHARMARGFSAYLRGQWRKAEVSLGEALEIFTTRCTGVAWEIHTARLVRTEAISNQGRLAEVGRTMRRSLAQAAALDNRYVASVYRTFPYVSVVWLAIDEPARARAELDAGLGRPTEDFRLEDYSALVTEANVLLYEGRGPQAHARVAEAWSALDASLVLRLQMLAAEAYFVRARAALAAGAVSEDPEPMQKIATESGKAIAELSLPQAKGMVALIRAQKARLRGRDDRAQVLLTEAHAAFAAADMGLHAAVCLRRLGELRGGRTGRDQAEAADRFMVEHGVTRPERLVSVFAPVG